MLALVAARSTALGALRSPIWWVFLASASLFWSGFVLLAPVGVTTEDLDSRATIYNLAFVALIIGNLQGLRASGRLDWLLAAHPGRSRLTLQFGLQLGATLTYLAGALLPGLLSGSLGLGGGEVLLLLRGTLLGVLLASLPRLVGASSAISGGWLLAMVWWLPAVLGGADPNPNDWVRSLQPYPDDLLEYLGGAGSGMDLARSAWRALLGPIIGWAALACLLADGRRGTKHAIRNPG